MTYIIFLTAAGNRIAINPKRQRSIFRRFQDGLIAESRLGEKDLSYDKYRAKRDCQGVLQSSVSVVRSVQKELDRLDESAFARLDEALVSLAKRPKLTRSKPRCFKWLLGDLRLAAAGDYSVVYTLNERATHLRVLMVAIGRWIGRRNSVKSAPTIEKPLNCGSSRNVHGKRAREAAVKRTDTFVAYSGETAKELFSYPPKGQHEALVEGFREGIQQKAARKGERALTNEERVVLIVAALEQEVNNGGFDQFFRNSSRRFAPRISDSLLRIRCSRMATIAQRAVNALGLSALSVKRIETTMTKQSDERDQELERCDQLFYKAQMRQNIPKRLYAFVRQNKEYIKF